MGEGRRRRTCTRTRRKGRDRRACVWMRATITRTVRAPLRRRAWRLALAPLFCCLWRPSFVSWFPSRPLHRPRRLRKRGKAERCPTGKMRRSLACAYNHPARTASGCHRVAPTGAPLPPPHPHPPPPAAPPMRGQPGGRSLLAGAGPCALHELCVVETSAPKVEHNLAPATGEAPCRTKKEGDHAHRPAPHHHTAAVAACPAATTHVCWGAAAGGGTWTNCLSARPSAGAGTIRLEHKHRHEQGRARFSCGPYQIFCRGRGAAQRRRPLPSPCLCPPLLPLRDRDSFLLLRESHSLVPEKCGGVPFSVGAHTDGGRGGRRASSVACPAAGNGARGLRGGNGAGESSKRKAILVPRGQNRVGAVAESVRLSDCFCVRHLVGRGADATPAARNSAAATVMCKRGAETRAVWRHESR